jgi:hypothetical protein
VNRYLEIDISRQWRLAVTRSSARDEFVVSERHLAAAVREVLCRPDILDFRCAPISAEWIDRSSIAAA